ncbi:MAG: hypothetical protein IT210_19210 [Armatimonadetes bacterium]|nr:hypothetical protein [Armatimonadota bacterium]
MTVHDLILLALKAMGGKVQGKTLFQKRLYFIGLLTGHLSDLGYVAHYYGPYSETVADAIGELCGVDFFAERTFSGRKNKDTGFEMVRTDYTLTPDGQEIASLLMQQYPEAYRSIASAWTNIEKAGTLDYMQLSIAAKVFYILNEHLIPMSAKAIQRTADSLGWTLEDTDIETTANFLMNLNLVDRLKEESVA